MFAEDVELCRAIRVAGWKISFLPEARVYHVGGQSTIQAAVKNFQEGHRSLYRYFRRHHGRFAAWIVKLIVGLGGLMRLFALSLLMAAGKSHQQPRYWRSRREQFRGHAHLFLHHWFY